ncbi:hypothetical protein BC829DRAFT_399579 [Chytridium lagenaria]|nr:hypothetical protein BC829DRAFT_399579 [Chytridium lagenaria]
MLDRDKNFRGPCNECSCTEYAINTSSQRCDECKHSATATRLWTSQVWIFLAPFPPPLTFIFYLHANLFITVTESSNNEGSGEGKLSWKEKMNKAMDSKRDDGSTKRHIVASAIIWCVLTVALAAYTLSGKHRLKKYDRQYADNAYEYAIVAFSIGSVFAMTLVLFWINAIAAATYVVHYMRLTPTLSDSTGKPMDPARFLEWYTTCPVTIKMIGELTSLLLTFGFLASTVREPYSYLFSTCAVACFTYVFRGLWDMFTMAADGETDSKLDPGALKAARAATCYSWFAFPIAWHCQKAGIVSYATGEAMFCTADVFSKVLVTLILLQNAKVSVMSTIANELESAMEHSDRLFVKDDAQSILDQIKSGKATSAEEYQSVTTKDMLATLNKLWVEYDAIAKRWGMYKVETIGDAYLGVTGAPERKADHAERATNFSLDVIEMVKTFKTAMGESIQIRVGLNSGPITAGILGEENPHWCIVGDTVNTGAMQIHISESTYDLIKDKNFKLSPCETMAVKGKGSMRTYWVLGRN